MVSTTPFLFKNKFGRIQKKLYICFMKKINFIYGGGCGCGGKK